MQTVHTPHDAEEWVGARAGPGQANQEPLESQVQAGSES